MPVYSIATVREVCDSFGATAGLLVSLSIGCFLWDICIASWQTERTPLGSPLSEARRNKHFRFCYSRYIRNIGARNHISAVAEHIPIHEFLRIHSFRSPDAVQIMTFGSEFPRHATCPKLLPYWFHTVSTTYAGIVSIVVKSGALGYEAVASTTRVGLVQSCVSGDALVGINLREALEMVWEDKDTEGVVVIREVGGMVSWR